MRKLLLLILASTWAFPNAQAAVCEAPATTAISTNLEISALYPNPPTGESEWIELTNLGTSPIDLSLYTLEDETAKPWTPSGTLEESVTLTGFSFQLNNGTETVTLKTKEGTVVDSFHYTSSTQGEILTKAPPIEPETEPEPELTETGEAPSSHWPEFSEALPNPAGSDSTDEWIELYNPYGETLTLDGLSLDDSEGGSTPYKLTGTLAPESYLLISVVNSKLTLNNDTDHVRLLGSSGELLWDVTYSGAKEGFSYALIGSSYEWTETPSPGAENQGSAPSEPEATEESVSAEESTYQNGDLSDSVQISEVFPNPEGPDTEEEWIEITNKSTTAINLGNWVIDDGEAGSKPYTFPDSTIIEPGATLIIYRTESGLALNNSNEMVQLSDYTGEVVDEISYGSSEEGQAYAEIEVEEVQSTQASASGLGNQVFSTWQWVIPSPGAMNPVWKQVKGTVSEWDGSLLTLFDGVSNWTFKASTGGTTDPLLYQVGNTILIQAQSTNGIYAVMHSELIGTASTTEQQAFPWTMVLSGFVAAAWAGYEVYKRRKTWFFHQDPLK